MGNSKKEIISWVVVLIVAFIAAGIIMWPRAKEVISSPPATNTATESTQTSDSQSKIPTQNVKQGQDKG